MRSARWPPRSKSRRPSRSARGCRSSGWSRSAERSLVREGRLPRAAPRPPSGALRGGAVAAEQLDVGPDGLAVADLQLGLEHLGARDQRVGAAVLGVVVATVAVVVPGQRAVVAVVAAAVVVALVVIALVVVALVVTAVVAWRGVALDVGLVGDGGGQ